MPLLSLPVELRLEIYRQLLPTLCSDKLIKVSMILQNCSYALDENVNMTWACDEAKDYVGLLSTCRTICAEISIMVNQFDVVLRLHESILSRDVRGAYYAASHPALQLDLGNIATKSIAKPPGLGKQDSLGSTAPVLRFLLSYGMIS